MDDQQVWNIATTRLEALLEVLQSRSGPILTDLLTRYRLAKDDFAAVTAKVGAASVCRDCGGLCCLNGKYRLNVLDYLARIAAYIPTVSDFAQKPLCPYGTAAGCAMEPGLRPADCVLFICDAIDCGLSSQARLILAEQEQILRECVREASCLTGEQMGTPLLLWAGRSNAP